jgi:hypothetical protein
MTKRELIIEFYSGHDDEGILFADGLDEAIIGFEPNDFRVVYSRSKIIDILAKDMDGDVDLASEYAEYNTFAAYVGQRTPIWVDDFNW